MTYANVNVINAQSRSVDDLLKKTRSSGALAPLFSLPGIRDVGSLGRCARNFVDFLEDTKQSWWQTLPITPIDEANSPYAGQSAFAGETLYLDLEDFRDEGLLDDDDLTNAWFLPQTDEPGASSTPQTDARSERIDYQLAIKRRKPCWKKAFDRYKRGVGGEKYRREEKRFREENEFWLRDFLLFQAATKEFGCCDWRKWPLRIRRHEHKALVRFEDDHKETIDYLCFLQLAFDVQWRELREYCASKSIRLIGDIPFYVGIRSADVWSHRKLFLIAPDGKIIREAGTPPDNYNSKGQRWGTTVYDWEKHKETDYEWWKKRMVKTLDQFDAVRLDHFIGFYNYFSFPGDGLNPITWVIGGMPNVKIEDGSSYEKGWLPGPQNAFFEAIFSSCPKEAFIAEDLGNMNPGVAELRDSCGLPGMEVLQFSFDKIKADPQTGIIPNPLEEWRENFVAYTGTHDAQPVLGWLDDLRRGKKQPDFAVVSDVLKRYARSDDAPAFCPDVSEQDDATDEIAESQGGVSKKYRRLDPQVATLRLATLRAVAQSPCKLTIFPIQDVIGLSNDSRINYPGVENGNWTWRMADGLLTSDLRETLRTLTEEANR